MKKQEQTSYEHHFLVTTIDKIIGAFLHDIPEPIRLRNNVDYTSTLNAFKVKIPLLVKATNYIVETEAYSLNYKNRLDFEMHSKKATYTLDCRKALSQEQQLALSSWFCIVSGLDLIKNTLNKTPNAACAKERAFLYSSLPIFTSFVIKL